MALDWLKKNVAEARARVTSELKRFANRDMMQSMVSAIAKTAYADGDVSSAEKQKMVAYLSNDELFKVFKTAEVIEFFKSIVDKYDFDKGIGDAEALKYVGRMRGNEEAARLIVRVCCVIGAADGDFSTPEKASVADICRELGLDPAQFDL